MYEVIGSKTSRAFRILWALEELGEAYQYSPEKPHSERVTSLNPSGKIPILKDGDTAIPDSTAILTYLADKHGKLTFPAGTLDRARQDAVTHCILDEIDAVLWTAARHSFALPEELRVPSVKESLKWEYARNIDRLMQRVQGPFLIGETFTIADIILTHCGNWAYSAKFPTENKEFAQYCKNMRARPAFQRVRDM
ncbi:glutathione S-transferase family protein [Shimia litoralis]|uniref:Glutathione S-transferase family protein n=1 Tax=Shimia litoralis TaxID=420403 RepID=A0A4U7MWA4_9RHOB|nr:glutathione S-transferase family protein [Shimia litoralis]TKZ17127.1 glutathione S-transferase family protein [Shimia litoralis]